MNDYLLKSCKMTLAAAGLACGVATTAPAAIIGDSVTGFSGTQGLNGWYYGYALAVPADGGLSTSLPWQTNRFEYTSKWWWYDNPVSGGWAFNSYPSPHNLLQAASGNSGNPQEQWTVRRWVSDFTGTVEVSYSVQAPNYKSNDIYLDGITAYVTSNYGGAASDVTRFGQAITNVTTTGTTVQFAVITGSVIDFAISPNAYSQQDEFNYTLQIASVPEPASLALLLLAGTVLARRRIARRC